MTVKIEDEVGRCLLSCMDGTRDRQALVEEIWRMLKSKGALAPPGGNEAAARRAIETELEENLKKLARMGLLVG
jgi:hypothetical protein